MELVSMFAVAAALFVATNIDEIFVLVAFFADRSYTARQVVIGQFLGIGALTALSIVGGLVSFVAPLPYIGLLGIVPFALGAWKLVELLRGEEEDESTDRNGHSRILAIALVTIANGGDNLGAYIPVFATRTPLELVVLVIVFAILTAATCWLAHALVTHPRLGPPIKRIAAPLTPFVLMAIGVLVVVEAGSYRLVL